MWWHTIYWEEFPSWYDFIANTLVPSWILSCFPQTLVEYAQLTWSMRSTAMRVESSIFHSNPLDQMDPPMRPIIGTVLCVLVSNVQQRQRYLVQWAVSKNTLYTPCTVITMTISNIQVNHQPIGWTYQAWVMETTPWGSVPIVIKITLTVAGGLDALFPSACHVIHPILFKMYSLVNYWTKNLL